MIIKTVNDRLYSSYPIGLHALSFITTIWWVKTR